jgi:hypothetical protein
MTGFPYPCVLFKVSVGEESMKEVGKSCYGKGLGTHLIQGVTVHKRLRVVIKLKTKLTEKSTIETNNKLKHNVC